MKVEIVTVCYNSENSISFCLESIINQKPIRPKVILIDGNSKDRTVKICRSNLTSADIIISENDLGIYNALNKGVYLTDDNIIGILHSDDQFASKNVIKEVLNVFKKTNCDGVYGDLDFIKNSKVVRSWKSKKFTLSLLDKGWMPPHPTIFLKKSVYIKHGLFDENFKIAADYDFILRIFKDESLKFEYLPIVITNMSIGGVSTSGFKNLVRKSYEDWLVLKKNEMRFPLFILLHKIFSKLSQYYKI